MEFNEIINQGLKWVWALVGILCLGGVIFAGAWWHLFTASICAIMFLTFQLDEQPEDETDNG